MEVELCMSKKIPFPQVSQTVSIPAPTGGLNTRSPLANMPENFAVQLTNAIPTPLGISVRKGYKEFAAAALSETFHSLIPYNGAGASPDRLFAAAGELIYDVLSGTPVLTLSGLSSDKFEYTQISTQGGQYLILSNGIDVPIIWDGIHWLISSLVPSPAAPGEWHSSTVVLEDLINPIIHQKRIWWVKKNSTRIVYSDINSIGGDLTSFDVGALLPRGGTIIDMVSWSSDNGSGMANRLAVVSSEGDVVIFDGSDPSDATAFSCSGSWSLNPPAYNRPFLKFDGEVFFFSNTGLYPLSSYLQNTTTTTPLSEHIRNTIGEVARLFKGIHGFDMISVASENLLIVNIPQLAVDGNIQFVMNTTTLGWALFTGIPAVKWANLNGETYFISKNKIHHAFQGFKDDSTKSYTSIIQQAFSTLGMSGANKHATLVRANLISGSSNINLKIAIKTDFDISAPDNVPSVVPQVASLWDSSYWDGNNWGSDTVALSRWNGTNAYGVFHSVILVLQAESETIFTSSDLVFQVGGIIS